MPGFVRLLLLSALLTTLPVLGQESSQSDGTGATQSRAEGYVGQLQEPMYTPFVERYVLDELRRLRNEQAQTKQELVQQFVDRQHRAVDSAVSYATDTVTYFFYVIAAASSVLVVVGYTSMRDIKEKVRTVADEKISRLVTQYEQRLESIESQLQQKSQSIEENREEIELTQEVQSLWLRAQQEASPMSKISIYDQLLKLRHDDGEALTYKADAVLELNEPLWASNLCRQALRVDPDNSHAYYQLACACAAMQHPEEAVRNLAEAIERDASFRDAIASDPHLTSLRDFPPFLELIESAQMQQEATNS